MLSEEELLNGIVIPFDKPRQWSSFQAVGKVKSAIRQCYNLKKIKIGHAGTLDPLASGLLLICVGKATKSIEQLQAGDKVYTGTMALGVTTPCYDLERPINGYYPTQHITLDDICQASQKLTGHLSQVPPLFSAVKVAGQRAYRYARLDDPTAVITPKEVTVHSFQITAFRPGDPSFTPPPIVDSIQPQTGLYKSPLGIVPEGLPQIDFKICCGKGTYIRSLARDLGLLLDSGAFLTALRRESVGSYSVAEASTPDTIVDYLKQL
ncbi:MAG: tRNA pseudouridine(55) synthase TruB [Bacteroidales bacterium]|nr:tRNA pseudouridine(55) synthase TruB [Candidatus Colimorpha onthohippi]